MKLTHSAGRIAAAVLGLLALAAGPARADSINPLVFDTTPGAVFGGNGGNPTQAQLDDLSSQNASALGVDAIELLGTFSPETGLFTAATSSFDGTFLSFSCAGGDECNMGFSLTFDFENLPFDWQIVQLVVKSSASFPVGAFTLAGPGDVQVGPLDDIQGASVSNDEYAAFVTAANALCGGGGCKNGRPFNPAIGHILVFGTRTTANVPEPGTLLLVGSGLLGTVFVMRRRTGR